jgi:Reverse transcriptase (RNA-dependent DNA polymerase)
MFPTLQPHSLLSVGQLCDVGCVATFDRNAVEIKYNDDTILQGDRNPITRLWSVPVQVATKLPKQQSNMINHHSTNIVNHVLRTGELVAFAHAALFSPTITTLQKALRNNLLVGFPGLTLSSIRDFPPITAATIKGHLDQNRQNKAPSNKIPNAIPFLPTVDPINTNHNEDMEPLNEEPTQYCFAALLPIKKTGQVYSDQTGRFPTTSSMGNTQIFVLYDYDSNSIHAQPMQTKSAQDILFAYTTVANTLIKAGLRPKLQKMDNECSSILKDYMEEEHIALQFVPPGVHRANSAERAIRTFKNHLISGLSTTDPNFPMHLWDRLIPQAVITLNLLRTSRINPNLSAYAQVFGAYNFAANPLAPPGTHVLVHEKPAHRASWAPHAVDAWYVGPAVQHYRCHRVWVWETRHERITDTVTWVPKTAPIPLPTIEEMILATSETLLGLLRQQPPPIDLTYSQTMVQLADQLGHPFPRIPTTVPVVPPHKNPTMAPSIPLTQPISPVAIPTVQPTYVPNALRTPQQQPLQTVSPPRVVLPTAYAQPTQTRVVTPPRVAAPTEPNRYTPQSSNTNIGHNKITQSPTSVFATYNPYAPLQSPTKTPHNIPYKIRKSKRIPKPSFKRQQVLQQTAQTAINVDTGAPNEYHQLLKSSEGELWEQSACEEWARLAQGLPTHGIPTSEGTGTIKFIPITELPKGRKATYPRIVVADRPQKQQSRRVRVTVGGDQIHYPHDVSTKTSSLVTVKLLINSTISTPSARFMCIDIKDFYLNTPMNRAEYMRVPIASIPSKIIAYYNLQQIAHNSNIYVEINKGMYGLPQAGRLANDELVKHLQLHGYHQCRRTPGLFTHETRKIQFCLVVDDFGVKYEGKENAQHLIDTLSTNYEITVDWTGDTYLGMNLDWNYDHPHVDISMPGYISKALQRFEHPNPKAPQHAPHPAKLIQYGAKIQFTDDPDTSPAIAPDRVKRLQQIVGTFLYYARAIDSTMLVALGTLASAQTRATLHTEVLITHFLDYAATNPDASVRYYPSNMILNIHSDASYLSEPQARSRAGGIFYMSANPTKENPIPKLNGAVHITSKIMKNVLASVAEAEVAACFHNAQDACTLRNTLATLGHIQPPTPIQTDNDTAEGILNASIKQKRSQAIDMRYYWLQDRIEQKQYTVHWKPGTENYADYFTKHFPAKHHIENRPLYIYREPP